MNEQLLLSKAFWSEEEYDAAIANIIEFEKFSGWNSSSEYFKENKLTKEQFEYLLHCIRVLIECTPKYVGVFDSYNEICYKGYDFETFKQYFAVYCFIVKQNSGNFSEFIKNESDFVKESRKDRYLNEFRNNYPMGSARSWDPDCLFLKVYNFSEDADSDIYKIASFGIFDIPLILLRDGKYGHAKKYNAYGHSAIDTLDELVSNYSDENAKAEYNNLINEYTEKIEENKKVPENSKKDKSKLENLVLKEKEINESIKRYETLISYKKQEISRLENKIFGKKKAKLSIVKYNEEINEYEKEILKCNDELTVIINAQTEIKSLLPKDKEYQYASEFKEKLFELMIKNNYYVDYEWSE